ncbi:hypothetical protein PTKU46_50010 [Paraburkholderia terrae]
MRGFERDGGAVGQAGEEFIVDAFRVEARSVAGREEHAGGEGGVCHGWHQKVGFEGGLCGATGMGARFLFLLLFLFLPFAFG